MKVAMKDQCIGNEINLRVIETKKSMSWSRRVGFRLGALLNTFVRPTDEIESWRRLEYRRENPPPMPIEHAQWRL